MKLQYIAIALAMMSSLINGQTTDRNLRSWPEPLEEDPDSYDYPSGRILMSKIVEARDLQNKPEKGEKYHQIDHHN